MEVARRLVRLPAEGRIAGVCAGIADYLAVDITLVRLAWVVFSIVPGCFIGGALAYVAAWIIMPESNAPASAAARSRLTRSPVDRKIAGVCGGIAELLAIDSTVVRVAWVILTIVPGAIVLGAVAYLLAWFIIPDRSAPAREPAPSAA